MKPSSRRQQSSHMAAAMAFLLLVMGSTAPQSPTITTAAALTLPNLIGAISHQQRQHQRSRSSSRSSRNKSPPSSNQMHSITLTIDDTDPSGLWNVMKSPPRGRKNSASSSQSSLQQRRRIGFRFFRSSDSSADKSLNEEGLAEDDLTLPSSTTSSTSSSSSSSLLANSYSSASTNTASAAAAAVAAGNNTRRQHGARAFLHGIKRNLMSINMAISISTGVTTATGGATTISGGGGDGGGGGGMSFGGVISRHLKNRRLMVVDHRLLKEQNQKRQRQQQERQLDSSSVVFETVDYSTKTTPMASSNTAAAATTRLDHEKDDVGLITADLMEDITAAANDVGLNVDKAMRVVTSAPPRGGDLSSMTTSSTDVGLSTETIAADTTSSTTTSSQQEATFIIETPLFPIILPKAWEAPFMGTSSYSKSATRTASSSSTTTTTTSSSSSYISSMEITVAPPEDITTTSSSSGGGTVKPTSHQLQQVTLPLTPKSQWTSFTGQEFFYPEPYNGLVDTGVCMASNTLSSEYVTWSGDKKTEKFIKDYMTNDDGGGEEKKKSWYDALDSSQEVLVWSGKFISSNNEEYYGSELPIIKTTSIIHKSPKYLAELLMDSTKVKAYNKMSLGRDDVHVFQSGVDTSREDGKLGVDGECKIVRNLTRPPMVNSNLEFVTCMHARKLSEKDLQILSSNNNDPSTPTNGYIVVSRAVTGGQWSSSDSSDSSSKSNVRNEIILGVNILREVPSQPNKTELIAITHVYSPMIPLMLAKNAGVKGAVDFVRDVRSLP